MLEIEEFRKYLQNEVKIGTRSISSYTSINDLIPKLENIEDYNGLNDIEKIIKFSKEKEIEKISVKSNISKKTLSNYKSYAKQYISFLKYIEAQKNTTRKKLETKNIMLYGAPGVGKTYNYKKLVALIEWEDFKQNEIFDFIINNEDDELLEATADSMYNLVKNEKRIEFVTFHQSYSYEDFIEGFRPQDNGNIKLEDGIFKILCEEAKNSSKNFYIVIDEINRGNISKIFGELITLIEEDKRDDYEVTLPYSKEKFKIPSNLYIIATMNSTDKSIATIDIALRRRFTFLKMKPKEELVKNVQANKLMKELNNHIKETISEDYQLGHSYFMKIESDEDLAFVKKYKIQPLLEEYFYGDETNYNKAIGILGIEDEPNKQ